MISVLERCIAPHAGVEGGLPGGRTYGVLDSSIYGQGVEIIKTPDQPIAKGDLISIRSGGGGGYGQPPPPRDPERFSKTCWKSWCRLRLRRSSMASSSMTKVSSTSKKPPRLGMHG